MHVAKHYLRGDIRLIDRHAIVGKVSDLRFIQPEAHSVGRDRDQFVLLVNVYGAVLLMTFDIGANGNTNLSLAIDLDHALGDIAAQLLCKPTEVCLLCFAAHDVTQRGNGLRDSAGRRLDRVLYLLLEFSKLTLGDILTPEGLLQQIHLLLNPVRRFDD